MKAEMSHSFTVKSMILFDKPWKNISP